MGVQYTRMTIEMELVAKKLESEENEMKAKGVKYLSEKEALGKYKKLRG